HVASLLQCVPIVTWCSTLDRTLTLRRLVSLSTLTKQLMKPLHSKKGQDRTLPASLWMRYQAVEQKTLGFADLRLTLRGQVSSP
ncbi:MAG: hypothetical protein WAX67_03320, partial [Rugosibacter sp.]